MTKNIITTINVSCLLNSQLSKIKSYNVIKKIEKACIEVGFFQIIGHGINQKKINELCRIGNEFFNSTNQNKIRLAPKKWNKKNKNIYRGYFPNDVNGKEGLDLGDLKISKTYAKKVKNQYIEYLDLKKSLNKKSIKVLSNYFDSIFDLSETLFKSVIKIYKKNPDISKKAFSRLKTLSTLRFNYYPNQIKPVETSLEQ